MFFIVGKTQFGLYSPDGGCQYAFTPSGDFPANIGYLTLALLDKQIVGFGGNSNPNCYLYDVATNSWSIYSTGIVQHNYEKGVVHQGKIYLLDDTGSQVFDPITKILATWPNPPLTSSALVSITSMF